MTSVFPRLSNSGVLIARDDLEIILSALVSVQHQSGEAAAIIIDRLDALDGDPDAEDDDPREEDDPSGQCDEDEINTAQGWVDYATSGPGCQISDEGVADSGGLGEAF